MLNIKYCFVTKCNYNKTHVTKEHICGKCNNKGHGQIECGKQSLLYNLNQYYNDTLPDELHCSFYDCNYKHLHITNSHTCLNCKKIRHSPATCNLIKKVIKCPLCKEENVLDALQKDVKGIDTKCCICLENNVNIYFPKCGHLCVCRDCYDLLNNKNIFNKDFLIKKEQEMINDYNNNRYDMNYIKYKLLTYPSYIIYNEGMGSYHLIRRLNVDSPLEFFFVHSDDHMIPNHINYINNFLNGYAKV